MHRPNRMARIGRWGEGCATGRPATRAPRGSAPARSRARDLSQRLFEFADKVGMRPLDSARPADQHVIVAGKPMLGQHLTRQATKTPLHPVADDGVSDFLRHGDADSHGVVAIAAIARLQDESRHRCAFAAVRREIIAALGQSNQALSFLRPRARRARITLRPAAVAIRAKKPCRRARTRLLG